MFTFSEKEQLLLDHCDGSIAKIETWWMITTSCTIDKIEQERPDILRELKLFLSKLNSIEAVIELENSLNNYLLTPKGFDDYRNILKQEGNPVHTYIRMSIEALTKHIKQVSE